MLILFVAAPDNGDLLDEACRASGYLLTKQLENQRVSIAQIVKTRNLSGYAMIVFDVSIIECDEQEINAAVYSMQFMYPQIRMVVLDFHGGNMNTLLHLQEIGVENIVQKPEEILLALSPIGMKNVVIEAHSPPGSENHKTTAPQAEPAELASNKADQPRPDIIIPPATETREASISGQDIPSIHTTPEEPLPNQSDEGHNAEASRRTLPSPFMQSGKADNAAKADPIPTAEPHSKEPISLKLPPLRIRQQSKRPKPVTIGVCGITRRIGTTTHALGISSFLIDMGEAACCVEANGNGHMHRFAQYYSVTRDEYGNDVFAGIPIILPGASVPEDARYIVSDYGLLDEKQAVFMESDIMVVCIGSKPWELSWLGRLFQSKAAFLSRAHYIFCFTDEHEQSYALSIMGKLAARTRFSAYAPSFNDSRANYPIYKAILSERLTIKSQAPK